MLTTLVLIPALLESIAAALLLKPSVRATIFPLMAEELALMAEAKEVTPLAIATALAEIAAEFVLRRSEFAPMLIIFAPTLAARSLVSSAFAWPVCQFLMFMKVFSAPTPASN